MLVIEADLRRPKVADLLGLERNVGLTSVLSGRIRRRAGDPALGRRLVRRADQRSAAAEPERAARRPGTWRRCCSDLRDEYDVVLIDSPPLLPVTDAAAVAPATDGAILICRYKKTTRTQVATAVSALRSGVGAAARHGVHDGADVGSAGVCAVQLVLPHREARRLGGGSRELRSLAHRAPAPAVPPAAPSTSSGPAPASAAPPTGADHDHAARLAEVRLVSDVRGAGAQRPLGTPPLAPHPT